MALFPVIIDLELSNRCNLECVMCARSTQAARLGDMAPPLLEKVLDEALAVDGRWFRLHGIGEPLLSPLFRHAVERIKGHAGEHHIELITNAQLLDRDMARFILRQGVDLVTVSVGAATAATYRAVRGSPRFDRVLRNTTRFIGERDRMHAPTTIQVQLVRVPPADGEVDAFLDFWSRWDVTIDLWNDMNRGRVAAGAPVGPPEPCRHLERYSLVTWDGRVNMCCIDAERAHVVGDANHQSLAAIFNGAPLERLRELHRRGEDATRMPICANCIFRDDSHVAFSGNVFRTGERPRGLPRVSALPLIEW